jgi:cell division protein FtsW (lipid II flippase)
MGCTYKPSSSFSGAIAGEKEDFCKGSLTRTIFYFVFGFALLYFCLHIFIKNTKKLVSFIVAFIYLLLALLELVIPKLKFVLLSNKGERA